MDLAREIESCIGVGKLACVKISKDFDTGQSRGYGHAEFFEESKAVEAVKTLALSLSFQGRKARVDQKKPLRSRTEDSLGPRERMVSTKQGKGVLSRAAKLPKLWNTVYAGNLPFDVSSDSLRFMIENGLGEDGHGAIAGVRIAENQETKKPRGFAHIDFFDRTLAERAVAELNGISLMGRPLRLDMEREKDSKDKKVSGSWPSRTNSSSGGKQIATKL
jgi:nucleolin